MEQNKLDQIAEVERHRDFLGMTRIQLCEATNIAPSTYFRWRRDGTNAKNVKALKNSLKQYAKDNKL